MRRTAFEKLVTVLMAFLLVAASASTALAARAKGVVSTVVGEKTEVCIALKYVFQEREENQKENDIVCENKGEIPSLVAIEGDMPRKIKEGQAVILRSKGTGKIMGTVVKVLEDEKTLYEKVSLITQEGANVLWIGEKGRICIIKTKKAFSPAKGDKVQMKVKTARARVEGC